jgi:hypothetical protein
MAKKQPPSFGSNGISWGQTVLIQSLIIQLMTTKVLTVEQAEQVFDIALQRTDKEKDRLPDASRFVQHVYENLQWDEYYKWSALNKKRPSDDRPKKV